LLFARRIGLGSLERRSTGQEPVGSPGISLALL